MLCSWVDPRLCRANLYWIDTTLLLWRTFFVWISLQDCLWFLWPQWPGQCFPSNQWRSCDNAWKEPSSQRGLAIGRQTPSACHKSWHVCFLCACSSVLLTLEYRPPVSASPWCFSPFENTIRNTSGATWYSVLLESQTSALVIFPGLFRTETQRRHSSRALS